MLPVLRFVNADRLTGWIQRGCRKNQLRKLNHSRRLERERQQRRNLGPIAAENRVKPRSETQNQAKRINEIVFLWLLRDQGGGGLNPLSPTILPRSGPETWVTGRT